MPNTMSPVTQKLTKEDLVGAARVGERVSIYDVRLTAQEVKLQQWDKVPPLMRLQNRAETKRAGKKIIVDAIFNFELAHDTDKSKGSPPVIIRAIFTLSYDVNDFDSLTESDLAAFGRMNGIYNAWPFWRELVYSTLSRMGMPPLTLPTYRVVEEEVSTGANESSAPSGVAEGDSGQVRRKRRKRAE